MNALIHIYRKDRSLLVHCDVPDNESIIVKDTTHRITDVQVSKIYDPQTVSVNIYCRPHTEAAFFPGSKNIRLYQEVKK